jgi:anti-sigma factor RsiW
MSHLKEKLAEFVFEELSPEEMSGARSHLAECGECRSEVQAFRQTLAFLRTSHDVEPPRRILFESEKPAAAGWASRWLSPAAAAIAASLLTAFLLRPAAPAMVQPVERPVVQQQAPAPVATPVDYERIIASVRESQDEWLAAQLKKSGDEQAKEIQRLRAGLSYLESLQQKLLRATYENESSIQMLVAQQGSSQD